MSSLIAKILVEGDKHFSSNKYGKHKNYPSETLYYANAVLDIMRENNVTHYINAGDLTMGNFKTLEYRVSIDKWFKDTRDIVGDNFWIVKGNHDKSSAGKTEYEYYSELNYFKTSKDGSIDIGLGTVGGGLHIELKDYDDRSQFNAVSGAYNIIIGHGLYTMKGDGLPNYGVATIQLDDFEPWKDVDMILAGHIHTEHITNGKICGKEIAVHYLPCLSRPAYLGDGVQFAHVDIISVYDDKVELEQVPIQFLDDAVSFDLDAIEAEKAHKDRADESEYELDITQTVEALNSHVRNIGDPIAAIQGMESIDEDVKATAVALLQEALNS